MSDVRTILDTKRRQVHAPPGSFDRLLERRDRKRRNQRLGSAILAIVVAAAAVGGAVVVFRSGNRAQPAAGIDATNVGRLRVAWTATTGSRGGFVTTADGLVLTSDGDGTLSAFPASCAPGAGTCEPRWTFHSGGPGLGRATVSDGIVYVATAATRRYPGRLYALPESCTPTCRPMWAGDIASGVYQGQLAPAVAGGSVFVGAADGSFFAFPTSCDASRAMCPPTWTAHVQPGQAYSWSIGDGVVYVSGGADPNVSRVYAFATDCATGGATCKPLWIADHMDKPTVADGVLYVETLDGTAAYDVSCGDPNDCRPLWTAHSIGQTTWPVAVGGGLVVRSTQGGVLSAYPATCSGPCASSWAGTGLIGDMGLPVVSNGVAYVATDTPQLVAYSARCGGTCLPAKALWTWSPPIDGGVTAPALWGGKLFAVGADSKDGGTLFALAPSRPKPNLTSSSRRSAVVFYAALLVIAAAALAFRVRRRRVLV